MASIGSVFIVGAGSVGLGLAHALRDCGIELSGIWARTDKPKTELPSQTPLFVSWEAAGLSEALRSSQIILLAVSDQAISICSSELVTRDFIAPDTIVAHTSGCAELSELKESTGSFRGGLHPLAAIPSMTQGRARLRSCVYAIEGEGPANASLTALAKALGGRPFTLSPGQRPRYHAAAVMASNLMVGLMDIAIEELKKTGLEEASEPLVELSLGAIEAVGQLGPQAALTGPVVRGDMPTIETHLNTLDGEAQSAYRVLSARLVGIAEARGLEHQALLKLRELLS